MYNRFYHIHLHDCYCSRLHNRHALKLFATWNVAFKVFDMFSCHITLHILKCMVCCVVNFVALLLQVEIMMALEEQISITLDEKGDEKFVTVQDVVDVI